MSGGYEVPDTDPMEDKKGDLIDAFAAACGFLLWFAISIPAIIITAIFIVIDVTVQKFIWLFRLIFGSHQKG